MTSAEPKRVFLSYAWDDEDYTLWVKALATRLRSDGVDARLDVWGLKGNDNIVEFMNREVRHADCVLVICSPRYQQKVRATEDGVRVAGVGWESRLLSNAMLVDNEPKVLAVPGQGPWADAAPDAVRGLRYYDLTDQHEFETEYEALLRAINGSGEKAPPLGQRRTLEEAPLEPVRGPYAAMTQSVTPPVRVPPERGVPSSTSLLQQGPPQAVGVTMATPLLGYPARVLQVLLASPGDVEAERRELATVITNWSYLHGEEYGIVLQPVRWEDVATPEIGDRPQEIINRQLVDRCDILIGMFWSRVGTPTGVARGGAVEEIERFINDKKPVLLYFCTHDIPRSSNTRQLDEVNAYRDEMQQRGLVAEYQTPADLGELVHRHLTDIVQDRRPTAPPKPAPTFVLSSPVDPPTDAAGFRQVSNEHLIHIAGSLLGDIPADSQWSRVRWKTIYTIDLQARLAAAPAVGGTLIQVIRGAGQALAMAALRDDRGLGEWLGGAAVPAGRILEPAWFVEQQLTKVETRLREQPKESSAPIEQHDAGLSPEILARVLLCEIRVYALLWLRSSNRSQRQLLLEKVLGGNLLPITQLVRELLIYNSLRLIDGQRSLTMKTLSDTAPGSVVDFLWPKESHCALEFDYLFRWQSRMNVVVLTDDCTRAKFTGLGPFVGKPGFEESYRAFLEAGRTKGLDIVLANHEDIELDKRRVAGWRLEPRGWRSQPDIYSEFFYDKFPTNVETTGLKNQIAGDAQITIWNKVVFTELLADKFELSTLLDAAHVPAVAPTRKMRIDADVAHREALVADLTKESAARTIPSDCEWLIVKPLTGWGGRGVQRLSRAAFLRADFTNPPYSEFAGLVVQPFFESAVYVPELDIRGRHDVRVVFVGRTPVFGMIRELLPGVNAAAASLDNIKKFGGNRRYVEVSQVIARPDAAALVARVPVALGEAFGSTPAIYSVDFLWIRQRDLLTPLVVELNSKPSQVWQPDDPDGEQYVRRFQKAIVEELAAFHD